MICVQQVSTKKKRAKEGIEFRYRDFSKSFSSFLCLVPLVNRILGHLEWKTVDVLKVCVACRIYQDLEDIRSNRVTKSHQIMDVVVASNHEAIM